MPFKNKEEANKYRREWYRKNKEKARAYHETWRKRNPEKARISANTNALAWKQRNPEKAKESQKKWRERNPDKVKTHTKSQHLKRLYGLTLEQFTAMAEKQGGLCSICGKKSLKLEVDHDHKTMQARNLLCGKCNRMIGNAEDNIAILVAGIAYLQKHQTKELYETEEENKILVRFGSSFRNKVRQIRRVTKVFKKR